MAETDNPFGQYVNTPGAPSAQPAATNPFTQFVQQPRPTGPPIKPLPTDPASTAGLMGMAAADAWSLGLSKDVIAGVVGGVDQAAASAGARKPTDFSTSFTNARQAQQTELEQFAKERPDLYWPATVAGALTSPGMWVKSAQRAAGAGATILHGAVQGGIAGAISGFGETSDQSLPGRLISGGVGAVGGAITGGVVAPAVSRIADAAAPRLSTGVDRAQGAIAAGRTPFDTAADAGEAVGTAFAGQAATLKQQAEDAYATSAKLGATVPLNVVSAIPQKIDDALSNANSFRPSQLDATQFPAAARAWQIINDGVGKATPTGTGAAPTINIMQGSAQYRASLVARGGMAPADIDTAVQEYQRLATQFNSGQLANLSQITALGAPGPTAATASGFALDSVVGTGTPSIREIQRQLNSKDDRQLIPSGASDAARLGDIRRAYDQQFAGLDPYVTGPPGATAAARQGNVLWGSFMKMTQPRAGDDAGNIVKSMYDGNMTGQQVADMLMGGANAATGSASAASKAILAVNRLKVTFGQNSSEFNAIQQGAFLRLVGDNPKTGNAYNPAQIKQNIRTFVDSTAMQPLSQAIFTPAQLTAIRRLGNSIPDVVISPNSSGAGMIRRIAGTTAQLIGFSIGAGQGTEMLSHLMPGIPYLAEASIPIGVAAGAAAGGLMDRALGSRAQFVNPLLDRPLWASRTAGAAVRAAGDIGGQGIVKQPIDTRNAFAHLPSTLQPQQ